MTNIVLNPSPVVRPLVDELRATAPASVEGSAGGDAVGTPSATSTSRSTVGAPAAPGHDALADTVEHLNSLMHIIRRELHFSVDRESGRTVIKVVDADTQEVIRNIPAEEVSKVAQCLDSRCGAGLTTGVHA